MNAESATASDDSTGQPANHPSQEDESKSAASIPVEKLALDNAHWPNIVRAMGIEGLPLQLAMHTAIGHYEQGVLTLLLPKPAQHLKKADVVKQLADSVTCYHEAPVKLAMEITQEALVTPASLKEEAARQAQQDAEDSIENDPLLAELLSRVDGEVTKNSVRPIQAQVETTVDNGENS